LDFVEDEERAVLFTETLDGGEVVVRRRDDAGFALEGFKDDGSDLMLAECGFERGGVTEGDLVGLRKHGTEAFFPEGVSHEGERAAGEAVKGSLGVDDSVAFGEDAGEFDGSFHAFAAGAAKESFGEMSAGERGEALCERSGAAGGVALQHGGPGGLQLANELADDVWMVVAGVVDAVAREEVEDDASVFGMQFGTVTGAVFDVHPEKAEESNPFRIDEVTVGVVGGSSWVGETFRLQKFQGQEKVTSAGKTT
jgi:hypothetical protein